MHRSKSYLNIFPENFYGTQTLLLVTTRLPQIIYCISGRHFVSQVSFIEDRFLYCFIVTLPNTFLTRLEFIY